MHRDEPRTFEPANQNPIDPGEEEPMKILDVEDINAVSSSSEYIPRQSHDLRHVT